MDLDDVHREQLRRRNDSALLQLLIDVEITLRHQHVGRQPGQLHVAGGLTPGDVWEIRRCLNRRGELDLDGPIGKLQIELAGGVVVVERALQIAEPIVALADHRVVADRVDPAALRRFDRRAQIVAKATQGIAVVAFIEQIEDRVVVLRRHGAADKRSAEAGAGDDRAGGCSHDWGGGRQEQAAINDRQEQADEQLSPRPNADHREVWRVAFHRFSPSCRTE